MIAGAFLTVAREDPDGFRLLWVHSAREPRFARHAGEVREASVSFARMLLGRRLVDGAVLDWAAPMVVSFLVEAVLNWLDVGVASDDDRFADLTTRSLEALVETWALPRYS